MRRHLVWDVRLLHFRWPWRDRDFLLDLDHLACWGPRTYSDCFSAWQKAIVFLGWSWRSMRCWYRVISLLHLCQPLLKAFLKREEAQNCSIRCRLFRILGQHLDVHLCCCCASRAWPRLWRPQAHLLLSWKCLGYFGLSWCILNQRQVFHRFGCLRWFDSYWECSSILRSLWHSKSLIHLQKQ